MDNITILLFFNIIIISLSFYFKKNIIIIYPFILLVLLTMYINMKYKINNEIIEGYEDKEISKFWDEIGDEVITDIDINLFGRINEVIKLLIDLEKTEEDILYGDKQCKGEFTTKLSDKQCGYNIYDDSTYIVSEPGINCEYPPGHVERKYKPLCKLDETCELDQDCKLGVCHNNKCKMDFECSSDSLEDCDKGGCENLNKIFGDNTYTFERNKCKSNKCREDTYYECDTKKSCLSLGYNYEWDPNSNIPCKFKNTEVFMCSNYKCPKGYSPNTDNKDYTCKRKLATSELEKNIKNPYVTYDDKGNGYLNECSAQTCCHRNYTCGEYYSASYTVKCKKCPTDFTKNESCVKDCMSKNENNPYESYKNGSSTEMYYYYKKSLPEGKSLPIEKQKTFCNKLECNVGECTKQNICKCDNGTPAIGAKCTTDGSNICASCKVKDGYNLNETLNTCDKCELENAYIGLGCGDYKCAVVKYHAGPNSKDCSKISASNVCVQSWFGTNSSSGGYRCLWRNDRCVDRGGLQSGLHCPLKPIPTTAAVPLGART